MKIVPQKSDTICMRNKIKTEKRKKENCKVKNKQTQNT